MADVGVDLSAEGWVTEAQTQAGARQIVQQLGRRNARDVLAIEAEGLNDGIAQSRCFFLDRLAEALRHCPLLIAPEGVLKERREQPRTKQRPTQLAQRQRVQPLPISQLQRSKPRVEHHEEDACQSEGDDQKGGLGFKKAVVEGRVMVGGHVWIYYSTLHVIRRHE